MDDETRGAIRELVKKTVVNQAHIMTILRVLAIKGVISTQEFNQVYDKTLKEVKGDIINSFIRKQDTELNNLLKNLRGEL